MAVSETEDPTKEEIDHRHAVLARIHLSNMADYDSFVSAVSGLRGQLDAIYQEREGTRMDAPDALSRLDALKNRHNQLLDQVRERLRTSLSFEGFVLLDSYVRDQVKRGIVIYGERPR